MPVYNEMLAENISGYMKPGFKQSRIGELALILGYASFFQGGPILELACGGGRIMNELAEYGHEVYGIEMSAPMLEYAKKDRAWRRPEVRERIHYIQGDMANFHLKKEFGLIIIPYFSFWFNLQPEEAERCLRLILKHLSPQGTFLIESPFGNDPGGERKAWWEGMAHELKFVFHAREYHTRFAPVIRLFVGSVQECAQKPDATMLEGRKIPLLM